MCSYFDNADFQKELYGVFESYHNNLEPILDLATIENDGIRPECLENEVYSLFHHISRSIFSSKNKKAGIEELRKGVQSHLRRAILDSYKISINSFLERSRVVVENIQQLILDEDFRKCINDADSEYQEICTFQKTVKAWYLTAKKLERSGDFDKAIEKYNEILDLLYDFDSKISEYENSKLYKLALQLLVKKEKEKKAQRHFTIKTIIISCILTSILTFIANFLYYKITTKNSTITGSVPTELVK